MKSTIVNFVAPTFKVDNAGKPTKEVASKGYYSLSFPDGSTGRLYMGNSDIKLENNQAVEVQEIVSSPVRTLFRASSQLKSGNAIDTAKMADTLQYAAIDMLEKQAGIERTGLKNYSFVGIIAQINPQTVSNEVEEEVKA